MHPEMSISEFNRLMQQQDESSSELISLLRELTKIDHNKIVMSEELPSTQIFWDIGGWA